MKKIIIFFCTFLVFSSYLNASNFICNEKKKEMIYNIKLLNGYIKGGAGNYCDFYVKLKLENISTSAGQALEFCSKTDKEYQDIKDILKINKEHLRKYERDCE